jgi:hypothetical protein
LEDKLTKKKTEVPEILEPEILGEVENFAAEDLEEVTIQAPKKIDWNFHVVESGDSYASIAAMHVPAGITKHTYAQKLFSLNNGKTLLPGSVVKL